MQPLNEYFIENGIIFFVVSPSTSSQHQWEVSRAGKLSAPYMVVCNFQLGCQVFLVLRDCPVKGCNWKNTLSQPRLAGSQSHEQLLWKNNIPLCLAHPPVGDENHRFLKSSLPAVNQSTHPTFDLQHSLVKYIH